MDPGSLVEAFLRIAEAHPQKFFAKLLFPAGEDVELTYGVLLQHAARYANFYKDRGVRRNQTVILILPHSPELIYSFVGAMLCGAIPSIFSFPSTKTSPDEYQKTLALLLKACDTRFVVSSDALVSGLGASRVMRNEMEILRVESCRTYSTSFNQRPSYSPDDIALLQHSSGTTGLKKGVAISNKSLMRQIESYALALELNIEDRIVSWLPLYHDMGLIACFILPLASGTPLVLMSPFDWVADPAMLFRSIQSERGTLCWQPNFAYNFLASRVQDSQIEGLDLSGMRAFINCAEPISADSHELFYQRFKKYGLKASSLCACYAMAENVFAVTQGGILNPLVVEEVDGHLFSTQHKAVGAGAQTTVRRRVVSSGQPIAHNQVRIVDAQRNTVPERHVGEIAIRSDSMLTEYYHRREPTKNAVEDGWYFTGDLGYLGDGNLFVTGRIKDMIIVAGKNIYPQDIEDIVSSVEGIHPGRAVAFGLYNEELGTEDVVILAETNTQDRTKQVQIKLTIAGVVRQKLDCVAHEIVLVPHMWLLKSSSGKISRSGNRNKYLQEWERGSGG